MLQEFRELPPDRLRERTQQARRNLATSECEMGMCLRAIELAGLHRTWGYSSAVVYAEKEHQLDGGKAYELLRTARSLESLPRVSEAYRLGQLNWTKIRRLTQVACSKTEAAWLEYALTHTGEELQRQVVMTPTEWRHKVKSEQENGALSCAGKTVEAPAQARLEDDLFSQAEPAAETGLAGARPSPAAETSGAESLDSSPANDLNLEPGPAEGDTLEGLPLPQPTQKNIQVIFEFTPEQYACYEQAIGKGRTLSGKRCKREAALIAFIRSSLDAVPSRTRVRHQAIIHINADNGTGWYETDRGVLLASPEAVNAALTHDELTVVGPTGPMNPAEEAADAALSSDNRTKGKRVDGRQKSRQAVPIPIVKALYARSSGRCEICSAGAPLHMHHLKPRSRGGTHDFAGLQLRCHDCHNLAHEADFRDDPRWQAAKARSLRARA